MGLRESTTPPLGVGFPGGGCHEGRLQNPGRLFRYAPAECEAIVGVLAVALRAESDVAFAYVHGSFVTERPFRDVDVGVHLAPEAEGGWERQMRLAETLEEAVASSPGLGPALPVDVRVLNRAPLGFCYQVLRRGELVFSRDEALRALWGSIWVSNRCACRR